ncbi:SRPBCC family protein [Actinomadura sp. DC4]|uniref:SRPBCC family protein n=1 Tax=Actinomadura sp. DC4 TaxID=3055069 RepID=UPI0025B13403|nr:SRPBCC family protein [Actinomadura sp. DC4]MDN3351934.1 SRPBCC family protein [Actinomadura sp. DC4]
MSDPVEIRVRLPASQEAARRAWAPEELRKWLAEYAEPFAFWGRHTPWGDEPRQRLLHLGDRTLRFSWKVGTEDTTVEVLFEDGALRLSQTTFDGEENGYPIALVLHVFWAFALGNLVDHLSGRPITPRCDYTRSDLRTEVVIGAPRAEVFASLTESQRFSQWFGITVEIEPYAGGRWAIPDGGPIGTVREVEQGRRLTLQEDSCVSTWDLADDGEGTRLTLALSGYDRPPYTSWTGWLSAVSGLRRYHELDDWRPIWE